LNVRNGSYAAGQFTVQTEILGCGVDTEVAVDCWTDTDILATLAEIASLVKDAKGRSGEFDEGVRSGLAYALEVLIARVEASPMEVSVPREWKDLARP
jgi:hypothetical protein